MTTLSTVAAPPDRDWLESVQERALEPHLPIIDSHHHLPHAFGNGYYLADMLRDCTSGHRIVGTVYIQAFDNYRQSGDPVFRPVGETEAAAMAGRQCDSLGSATRVPLAIVGFADLMLGEGVEPVVHAHLEAGDGRFRGVRHIFARDPHFVSSHYPRPSEGMSRTPAFRDGIAVLARLGLSFDCHVYHHQLREVCDLASSAENASIILDHGGTPLGFGPYASRRSEVFAEWRSGILELAKRPNVTAKIGGMGMALFGFGFESQARPPSSADLAAAWKPYVETLIEAFGPHRCMFESNFPADKGSCSYAVLWNAFKRLSVACSADERRSLFHDTAARIYRIEDVGLAQPERTS